MATREVPPVLRVTRRCLRDDLGFGEDEFEMPIEDLAARHPIVRTFLDMRSQNPEGQETIQDLTTRIVVFSLHSGEYRAATWHDREAGVVWLLAARLHRSGQPNDAYPYFRALDASARLVPERDDYLAHLRDQARTLARALLDDVPPLRQEAIEEPGRVHEALIGGRVRVRFAYEAGDPPMFTVAISQRLLPGDMDVPPQWQLMVAAAFLPPETSADDLSFAGDLAGERLLDDEVAYCDFVTSPEPND